MTTSTADLKPVLIGGEWRTAVSGATIDVTNPATGERIAAIPRCAAAEIDLAVSAAEAAFPAWSRTDAPARGRLLLQLGRLRALVVDVKGTPSPTRCAW